MGILVCLIVYGISLTFCVFYRRRAKSFPGWIRGSAGALLFFNTLALILFAAGIHKREVTSLNRGETGAGRSVHEMEMSIEGIADSENMEVEISEQTYTREQEKEYLDDCKTRLKRIVPGKGQKASHVTKEFKLPDVITGNPTSIEWRQDRYDVMNGEGQIDYSAVDEEGSPLTLTAQLTCGKTREEVIYKITIFPRELEDRSSYLAMVKAMVKQADSQHETAKKVQLPTMVGGKTIHWKKKTGKGGYLVLLIGVVCAVALFEEKRESLKRQEKKRSLMVETDYPVIVMTLSLLLRAGLTSRRALVMITEDYERRRNSQGTRPAYEALTAGIHQMEAGVTQEEVYLNLGHMCGSMRFERLGNLLAQNLRHGSGGLADQLARDAQNTFEKRKADARKKGEEAQIKLLMPMLILLAIVLMAVMIPAFLSMQV